MPSKKLKKDAGEQPAQGDVSYSLFGGKKTKFDPALASLFSSSSGPIKAPPKPSYQTLPSSTADEAADSDEQDLSEIASEDASDLETSESDVEAAPNEDFAAVIADAQAEEELEPRKRKRKRTDGDDLEGAYLDKLAREEEKENAEREVERKKRVRTSQQTLENDDDNENHNGPTSSRTSLNLADLGDIPKHESLTTADNSSEMDKAARTVFLGNVSTAAITSKSSKKTLLAHLASFLTDLPANNPPHKIESIRFRSTAFATAVPKKAAFAQKELMDTTTKSTNAYVVYTTKTAAREAARRLNGTVVLGRHLRADEVAHPAKIDHHRCVFVGNLGFVDDESQMKAAEEAAGGRKAKKTPAGDVEEGLWQQFGNAGEVESVRVVRDPKTRVGKGFAYVQFKDQNGVEAALLYNDKKYPPLLPRKLRVTRAKKPSKTGPVSQDRDGQRRGAPRLSQKPAVEEQSFRGRASKLLGRAGAAGMRSGNAGASNGVRKPEKFVFEGHRASSKQGNSGLRLGGGARKKKAGRPKNRSAKRGAEWKAKAKPTAKP